LKKAGFKELSLLVVDRFSDGRPRRLEAVDNDSADRGDDVIVVLWDQKIYKLSEIEDGS
jgi:hypothetical protein